MNRDLTELLDSELKGPVKMMLSQMPPMSFENIPAARAASRQMLATMKMQWPVIPGIIPKIYRFRARMGLPTSMSESIGRKNCPVCSRPCYGFTVVATCSVILNRKI